MVDDSGKRGSVERTFIAKINGFGQLHATDLLIADNSRSRDRRTDLRPSPRISPATSCTPTSSCSRKSPEQLRGATVVMDVAQTESSPALNSAAARFQQVRRARTRRAARRPACRSGSCLAGRVCGARGDLGRRAPGRPGHAAVPCGASRRRLPHGAGRLERAARSRSTLDSVQFADRCLRQGHGADAAGTWASSSIA